MAKTPRFLLAHQGKIFISYRRDETEGHAGRLAESLSEYFGKDQIFRDFDTIRPGDEFAEVINQSVASCDALLAVIGKRWAEGDNANRLNSPDDFVRLEIAQALKRKTPVIPVLVQGASIPPAQNLPEDLKPLLGKHAFELSESRWSFDADQLIKRLEEVLPPPAFSWRRIGLIGACLLLLIVGLWIGGSRVLKRTADTGTETLATELDRAQHPLLPIDISVGFKADLSHPALDSFRSRIIAATPPDGLLQGPELEVGGKLFPDPNREPAAYALVKAYPELYIFLVRNPTLPFDTEHVDLAFTLRTRKSEPNANSDPSYSARDGVMQMFFQGYTLNFNDKRYDYYSNGTITSTSDLPGTQIGFEIRDVHSDATTVRDSDRETITRSISLDYLALEFPGRREISLNHSLFHKVQKGDREMYVFTLPKDKAELEKLFVP